MAEVSLTVVSSGTALFYTLKAVSKTKAVPFSAAEGKNPTKRSK